MFNGFFKALDGIFMSFASGWNWLVTPLDLNIPNAPAWAVPILTMTPLSMISIVGVSIVLVCVLLKLVWDAIPIV